MKTPAEAWKTKRDLRVGYYQKIGMNPDTAQVPPSVEEYLHDRSLVAQSKGIKFDEKAKQQAAEFYTKVAKPRFDKEYNALMTNIHKMSR